MSSDNGKLLTIEETAKRLSLSERTVWKYIQRKVLKSSKKFNGGKRLRVMVFESSLSELLRTDSSEGSVKFIEAQEIASENVQGNSGEDSMIDQGSSENDQRSSENYSKEEALLQATYRIGWLESKVDSMQKLLTEGSEKFSEKELALQGELRQKKEHLAEIESKLQAEQETREKLEQELSELKKPWWKKIWGK